VTKRKQEREDPATRLREAGYLPIDGQWKAEVWFVLGAGVMNTEQALAHLEAKEKAA
jgi:hypothetical protein